MPIEQIELDNEFGAYRVHNTHNMYVYFKGHKESRLRALEKAKRQLRAIEASKHKKKSK